MKLRTLSKLNVFTITFFIFSGYYVVLALVIFLGFESLTRFFTIPIRIFVVLLIILQFLIVGIRKKMFTIAAALFYLFSLLYLVRICWELLQGNVSTYHRPTVEFLLYFGSFCIFPFLFFIQVKRYKTVEWSIFLSAILFAILSYFLYGSLLGQEFGRITTTAGRSNFEFGLVSPLALSYSSSFLLGLAFFKLYLVNDNYRSRLIYYFALVIGVVPFFLGSSRGSLLALFFSILFVMVFRKGYKATLKAFVFGTLIFLGLYIGATAAGSNIFTRLFSIEDAIATNASSAIRLIWWQESFYQFLENPIFGNSLESTFAQFYPHNLFIESMITMGVLGFGLLLAMMVMAFIKSIKIIRKAPLLGWISLLFVQAFIQNMFSGAIYTSILLWSMTALVFSVDINKYNLKNKKLS